MSESVKPFSLKDAPALIERLLPVQKLSAEAYKEQMAVHGKTLTALGSYWKGRKPLILNKACILGCLLPATANPKRDLAIFEKLMAMDEESFVVRWPRRPKPREILAQLSIPRISDYFVSDPPMLLPESAPVDWSKPELAGIKVSWRDDIAEMERRQVESQMLPKAPYRVRVEAARRPEEVRETVHDHIWESVNSHLGTSAHSLPDVIKQLGIMRFGHRPRLADTFCGSGQIPFEAARLGCDVFASDLNPIACMLTWGAFNIVGGTNDNLVELNCKQEQLLEKLQTEVDKLGIETDGSGWRAKSFLYCVEVRCPQTGWLVPLLSTKVISVKHRTIADLVPDPTNKRYDITILSGVTEDRMAEALKGTVGRDTRFDEATLVHTVEGVVYRTKIATLRGDFRKPDKTTGNRIRQWAASDFEPQPGDIFQERLYAVQWTRQKSTGKGDLHQFRAVSPGDLAREETVRNYVRENLAKWQESGAIPVVRIEPGGPPRYQGQDLIRSRGWTYWHHIFNPRQLMMAAFVRENMTASLSPAFAQLINNNCRLSRWKPSSNQTVGAFDNQALNVLYNYGCRGVQFAANYIAQSYRSFPLSPHQKKELTCKPADQATLEADLFVTDPPYGDAVMYHEILDFFIAWFRKNPPPEFARNYSGGCLSFWEERTTVEGAAKVIEDRQPLFAQGADIGSDPHMATGAV